MRNMIYIQLLILSALFMGCTNTRESFTDFSLVRYKKEDRFYNYDGVPLLEYKGSYYVHKDSSVYRSAKMQYLGSFEPEGIMDHSKNDLSEDSLLIDYLGLKHHKKIYLNQDTLSDGDQSWQYEKGRRGELICLDGNYLYIFQIK